MSYPPSRSGEGYIGSSQMQSIPSHCRYSSRSVSPRKSPDPSALESENPRRWIS